jgi:hypothetical protein
MSLAERALATEGSALEWVRASAPDSARGKARESEVAVEHGGQLVELLAFLAFRMGEHVGLQHTKLRLERVTGGFLGFCLSHYGSSTTGTGGGGSGPASIVVPPTTRLIPNVRDGGRDAAQSLFSSSWEEELSTS